MTWRIRDRATFTELRARGRRRSRGPLAMLMLPADQGPPQIAFAISRRVGSAVVRNRLRRRLRAIAGELAGPAGPLTAGSYLVQVRPSAVTATFDELRATFAELVEPREAR